MAKMHYHNNQSTMGLGRVGRTLGSKNTCKETKATYMKHIPEEGIPMLIVNMDAKIQYIADP